jgi:hypothetical protein
MYEVTDCDGELFYFETFPEIATFFGDLCWAVGADEAKISVRLVDREEYLNNLAV